MKALTLYQPYASAIALGLKQNETRPRRWNHQGLVAICSAQKKPQVTSLAIANAFVQRLRPDLMESISSNEKSLIYEASKLIETLPVGKVVAVAYMEGCFQMSITKQVSDLEIAFGHWTLGRYYYPLRDVVALSKPVPVRGHQGVFELPADVLNQVQAQLP